MESPFYPSSFSSSIFTLYLEPILDSYSQTYLNVITLSDKPQGPLSQMVRLMSLPKLSNTMYSGYSGLMNPTCTYVLMKYPVSGSSGVPKNTDCYMRADDIPAIFSYLTRNGYVIDTNMTSMMNKSRALLGGISDVRFSGDRKMICIVGEPTVPPTVAP
jgi:hypothetical protein